MASVNDYLNSEDIYPLFLDGDSLEILKKFQMNLLIVV